MMKKNKKKALAMFLAAFQIAAAPVNAWAGRSADRFAQASNGTFFPIPEGGVKSILVDGADSMWKAVKKALARSYRSEGTSHLRVIQYQSGVGGPCIYEISEGSLDRTANEDAYVKEWVKMRVPEIVPDGIPYEDAVHTIFLYISSNYSYAYEALETGGMEYQCAYSTLMTGKGVCSSLSKLFRCMLEVIPFDKNWNVSWTSGENHAQVAMVVKKMETVSHAWAAIRAPDGYWYCYDLSGACGNSGKGAPDQYYRVLITDLAEREIKGGTKYGPYEEWIWEY